MSHALLNDDSIGPADWQPGQREPRIAPSREKRSGRWWVRWLAAAACIAAAGLGAAKVSGALDAKPPITTAAAVARTTITALGWLEPASNVVRIAAPATVEASRIAELRVVEGDAVEAGQVVAVLDTAAKLETQLKSAEAQVALRQALLERVRADTESNAVAKRMAIARAEADAEQYQAEFERQRLLASREIATAANLEKRRRDLAVAQAQIEEARAGLKRLDTVLPSQDGRPTQIDVAVAERELASAQADLAQVRLTLDQASIRSPIKGRVLTVLARAGEKMSQDGVVEVGSTDAMVAIGEVYQSDIGLVRIGQHVEIRAEMLSGPVIGRVERIGLKVKRQSIINNDPATDTDARVIEVRVGLDPRSSDRVANLTRLQVRLHFALDPAAPAAMSSLKADEVQR